MQRPQPEEHIPYYSKYISLIGDKPFSEELKSNTGKVLRLFGEMPEEKQEFSYAPGKWTPKDMLMHLIDTERGMSYRLLLAVRGDSETPLYTMDEDLFANNVATTGRSMESLLAEFMAVRTAMELLLLNTPDDKTRWTCTVAGNKISARAIAYMILGHAQHHLNVLEERYL